MKCLCKKHGTISQETCAHTYNATSQHPSDNTTGSHTSDTSQSPSWLASAAPSEAHRRAADDSECRAANNNACSSYTLTKSLKWPPVPSSMEELDRIRQNALVERIVKHKPTVSSDYRERKTGILHISEFKRVHGFIKRDVSTHIRNHSAQIQKVVNSLRQLGQSAINNATYDDEVQRLEPNRRHNSRPEREIRDACKDAKHEEEHVIMLVSIANAIVNENIVVVETNDTLITPRSVNGGVVYSVQ